MRLLRALLMVLVVGNGLGFGLSVPTVSGASPAAPADSFTINVATPADIDPNAGPGPCSLRGALQLLYSVANGACGTVVPPAGSNVTIVLPLVVQLSLPNDLPAVYNTDVVNISGPGVIDGGSQNGRQYGIFQVVDGTLNLKDVTLQHGSRPAGGAIWLRSGTVIADNVRFDSNSAGMDQPSAGTGGAIMNDSGALTVTNSVFVSNLAYFAGGAVSANSGYFNNDDFLGNQASDGGAFSVRSYDSTGVEITDSQFKSNLARPQPALAPMALYHPNGDLYGGGAIHNVGNMSLDKVLLESNHAELTKGGGGLWNQGQMSATECVFTKNTAEAKAPGDNNTYISYAWGGAIINYGQLDLVRCSIHSNTADFAGGIFNHGTANLGIYNSTISNNNALGLIFDGNASGGIMNEHSLFDNAVGPGAQIYLYHVTIGLNFSFPTALTAMFTHSVWFSNSIVEKSCNGGIQYTLGVSVYEGVCSTESDPSYMPAGGPDIYSNWAAVRLQPLTAGSSTVPEFMVQPIPHDSIAAGVGRDNQWGCGQALVAHRDQNLAPRPVGAPCSAGAFEVGASLPAFSSVPAPGPVNFPGIDLSQAQTSSQTSLVLKNIGGGALTWELDSEGGIGDWTDINVVPDVQGGTIYENQETTLQFKCLPAGLGAIWRDYVITTNAPNMPMARYQLHCPATGLEQFADMDTQPGPFNLAEPAPAQTAHSSLILSNPGHHPLTAVIAFAKTIAVWALDTLPGLAQDHGAGKAPASPSATIQPGHTLQINVSCTPPDFGTTYVNTLMVTTDDPVNPTINYDLACEAQVTSPPEPLNTAIAYQPSPLAHAYGVAVSPDGAQVLAGGGGSEAQLSAFVRDPSTGALTQNGWVALPGMSAIQSIKYSHDGQYVYYTSADGNGLVAINSAGDALGSSQVITSGTPDNTCFIFHSIVPCPNNVMHGADGLAVSPDDQFVYVVGYYDNSLTTFQRQPNGQLDLYQIITGTQTITQTGNGLSGPVKVVTSPDGNDVYVASFNSSTVAVFQRTGAGALNFQAAYQNGLGGFANLGAPSDLAVSPDGNFLYVAASTSNAVDVFQRSSADGGLSPTSVITGVTGVWGLAITHDDAGRRLFLTTQSTNQVQVYGRDQTTGALSFVGANTVTDPVYVTASPDDLDVYASLYSPLALQHFQTVENAPVVTHLSPASAVVGGSAFTLTVGGGRFYPNSQIVWNGTPQPTVFVSEHELQASIPAPNIAAQGNPSVLIHNSTAGGGGGNSAPMTFAITSPAQPPVPSISSLDPPAASFGGGDLVVLVHGANFAPSAEVFYNLASVPTLFINADLLQITLSADILNTPGDGGLEVTNGGGAPALSAPDALAAATASGSSTVVSFRVNPPGVPAAPAVSRLEPASALVSGTASIWVTVIGHNFSGAAATLSVGRWNGLARPSVVLDANTLLMNLTPPDLAAVGNGLVTVYTPGVGQSAPETFRVRAANEKPVPVVTGDSLKGWTLYVLGSDFVPGAQVFVNGSPRATTFVNAYELTAVVTQADHGVVISVSNPGPGGGLSNALVAFVTHLFLPLLRR